MKRRMNIVAPRTLFGGAGALHRHLIGPEKRLVTLRTMDVQHEIFSPEENESAEIFIFRRKERP